jgi:hypothetical protein
VKLKALNVLIISSSHGSQMDTEKADNRKGKKTTETAPTKDGTAATL